MEIKFIFFGLFKNPNTHCLELFDDTLDRLNVQKILDPF